MSYLDLSTEDLKKELSKLKSEMEEIKALELNLDLSRGKPDKEQLNLWTAVITGGWTESRKQNSLWLI